MILVSNFRLLFFLFGLLLLPEDGVLAQGTKLKCSDGDEMVERECQPGYDLCIGTRKKAMENYQGCAMGGVHNFKEKKDCREEPACTRLDGEEGFWCCCKPEPGKGPCNPFNGAGRLAQVSLPVEMALALLAGTVLKIILN